MPTDGFCDFIQDESAVGAAFTIWYSLLQNDFNAVWINSAMSTQCYSLTDKL